MSSPYEFIDRVDAIAREAERLRGVSPEERYREFVDVNQRGWEFIHGSPHRGETLAEMARQQNRWYDIQFELFKKFGVLDGDPQPTPLQWSVTSPAR